VLCAGRVLAGLGAHLATTADQQKPSVLMALPARNDRSRMSWLMALAVSTDTPVLAALEGGKTVLIPKKKRTIC